MNGFGDPTEMDFWLGLEYMHLLTRSATYRLRVELQAQANGKYEFTSLLCNVIITCARRYCYQARLFVCSFVHDARCDFSKSTSPIFMKAGTNVQHLG